MLLQRNERSTDNNHFRWGAPPGSFWTRDAFAENRFYFLIFHPAVVGTQSPSWGIGLPGRPIHLPSKSLEE